MIHNIYFYCVSLYVSLKLNTYSFVHSFYYFVADNT